MIRIFFQGGLGNQMFQYAAGRALAEKLGAELCFDTSWYHYPVKRRFLLGAFGIAARKKKSLITFGSNLLLKKPLFELVGSTEVYREHSYPYDPSFFELPDDCALIGVFQTEKYFKQVDSVIRSEFSFAHQQLSDLGRDYIRQINECHSVAIHVRRGDYLKYPKYQVCSESYFQRAIDWIRDRVEDPRFFVFSDDLAWCRTQFLGKEFVFCESGATLENPLEDLQLLSSCQHHILSNSSFSWWGGWLGFSEEQLVVVPDPWFANTDGTEDFACERWHRLAC